ALVTQPIRGEVAVIDLSLGSVVDVDHTIPGYTFLHVGDSPGDIVSTPGGMATFVGVTEGGREGIFALPSSCIGPPQRLPDGTRQSQRDLTTWPACSLPVMPGRMQLLVDPVVDGRVRATCGADPLPLGDSGHSAVSGSVECPADLALE